MPVSESPLRVGIDASNLVPSKLSAGAQRYLGELVVAMVPQCEAANVRLSLYFSGPVPAEARAPGQPLAAAPPSHTIHWRTTPIVRGWRRVGMGLAMRLDRLDVFHFPSPLMCGYCPAAPIVTFHDLAPLSTGDDRSEATRAYLALARDAARRAAGVISVSRSTSVELARHLGRSDAALTLEGVTPARFRPAPASDVDSIRARYLLDRYVLCVGTLHARKNHLRLIQAFERIQNRVPHALVIAGGDGSGSAAIRTYLEQRPNPRIRCLGYVDETALPALYTGADVLALPSLWEGFGLPLLEAMSCGTPVLTSNVSALSEVAEGAGLLVDPKDVRHIADGLHRLLTDATLRDQLRHAGFVRARRFSWEETARRTIAFYHTVRERSAKRALTAR